MSRTQVEGDADEVRTALRELPRTAGGVLHYSKESPSRRAELAKMIAAMPFRFTAVVCRIEPRAERARGLCVRDLAWWTHQRLTKLVFEGRDETGNEHDASVLDGLQTQGFTLPCSFRGKREEPVLWVADLLAGAVRQKELGGSAEIADSLGPIRLLGVQQ